MFYLCFYMLEVISLFKCLRTGTHVFAPLMLFPCKNVHTMWSGKSLQLLCILHVGTFCLFSISILFVKMMLTMCMLAAMVV